MPTRSGEPMLMRNYIENSAVEVTEKMGQTAKTSFNIQKTMNPSIILSERIRKFNIDYRY